MNAHVSMASDPIIIDSVLIHTLQHYIEANVEEVSCFIAKFLNTFVTDSSLLEPYEVDNFILRNGRVLCAWYVSTGWFDQASNIFPAPGTSMISSIPSSRVSEFRFCFVSLSSTPNRSKPKCMSYLRSKIAGNGGSF